MKIVLNGSTGKMGKLVQEEAVCRGHSAEYAFHKGDTYPDDLRDGDVGIDFSAPDSAVAFAQKLSTFNIPVVVGTTGFTPAQMDELIRCSQKVPMVIASNFSIGIHVLTAAVQAATIALGDDFDIEIIEAHHRQKQDAPSGTALSLAKAIQSARTDAQFIFGRHGKSPRTSQEIGIHAVRGGSIVGDHFVLFCGDGETLTWSHHAADRRIFAKGAVKTAEKLCSIQKPGLYSLENLFHFSQK